MDAPASPIDDDLLDRFAAIVGDRYALRERDAVAPYLIELRDTKGKRHAGHRSEQVDGDRVRRPRPVVQHDVLEQQRGAAAGHLHRAIGDLAHLETCRHGMPNANELAGRVDGRNEIGE